MQQSSVPVFPVSSRTHATHTILRWYFLQYPVLKSKATSSDGSSTKWVKRHIGLLINLFHILIQYFSFRFRKSIIGCSKMFLAVSAAWDKWKENMREHLSGRREQPRWCCYGYYRKIWYCESMKWPSEQACLLTELLTGFVHRCAFMQNIYIMLYTNSIQNKLIIAKQKLIKTRERYKFLKKLKTFHDLGFVTNFRNICSSWKQDTKTKLAQQILWIALLVETCSLSFCSNELLTLSCTWPSAGNGFH